MVPEDPVKILHRGEPAGESGIGYIAVSKGQHFQSVLQPDKVDIVYDRPACHIFKPFADPVFLHSLQTDQNQWRQDEEPARA